MKRHGIESATISFKHLAAAIRDEQCSPQLRLLDDEMYEIRLEWCYKAESWFVGRVLMDSWLMERKIYLRHYWNEYYHMELPATWKQKYNRPYGETFFPVE